MRNARYRARVQNILGFVNPGSFCEIRVVAGIREFKIAMPTRHFWSYESTYIPSSYVHMPANIYAFSSIRLRLHKPQHGHFPAAARRRCIKHRDTRVFLRSSILERICFSRERYLPP
ncbi:hypothetical protein ACS0PU_010674 [Formica fusca]